MDRKQHNPDTVPAPVGNYSHGLEIANRRDAKSAKVKKVRQQRIRDVQPTLTVMFAQTLESKWLLEIEAIAAAVG